VSESLEISRSLVVAEFRLELKPLTVEVSTPASRKIRTQVGEEFPCLRRRVVYGSNLRRSLTEVYQDMVDTFWVSGLGDRRGGPAGFEIVGVVGNGRINLVRSEYDEALFLASS